ncbi:uncharacterized protein LOC122296787 [Carya illinoinensis]|uniref:uncharacterized protein LOC122296787 n=1 Tax=Carya illinoinensis TaxID=32201 RepID=UPI001C727A76|nr:uncharacterized protein LOC122296787 [Carya illinoinensis]
MTQESSLLHRIFKSRYFPTSFVWSGIWEAKTNLLKGCKWRVGNGLSINIWTDYWLPNHKLVPVTTTTATSLVSEMDNSVASLMMQNPRRWDMEKVRSLTPAREANEVLCIRLPSENVPDTLVWEHEKTGMYSVKSAYQFSSLWIQIDKGLSVQVLQTKIFYGRSIAELQIESDALLVIEELKKEGRSSTLWSSLIQEIKTLLSTLPNWSIQHRGRESNGVAHALAKFAWHLDDIALWWDSIPESISQAIWVDLSL